MNIEELYTVIIPTYNRHELLKQLINYFTAGKAKFKILVLDSSNEPCTHDNKIFLNKAGLNIEHIIYDKDITGPKKVNYGLKRVTTRYVSFCFDDDFSTVRGIEACVEFLENNSDYVSVQGYTILFTVLGKNNIEIQMLNKKCLGHEINGITASERLDQLFVDYVQQLCSVYRTDILLLAFDGMQNTRNGILSEIGSAIIPSIFGKHKVLPVFYSARRHLFGISDSYTVETPRFEILKPEGLKDYEQWRDKLAGIYASCQNVSMDAALAKIEKAFRDFNAWDYRITPDRRPIGEAVEPPPVAKTEVRSFSSLSFKEKLKTFIPEPLMVLKRKLFRILSGPPPEAAGPAVFTWPDPAGAADWRHISDIINNACDQQ